MNYKQWVGILGLSTIINTSLATQQYELAKHYENKQSPVIAMTTTQNSNDLEHKVSDTPNYNQNQSSQLSYISQRAQNAEKNADFYGLLAITSLLGAGVTTLKYSNQVSRLKRKVRVNTNIIKRQWRR